MREPAPAPPVQGSTQANGIEASALEATSPDDLGKAHLTVRDASPGEEGGVSRMRVLVAGRDRRPLMPCGPALARVLLNAGLVAILRRYPFTVSVRNREGAKLSQSC